MRFLVETLLHTPFLGSGELPPTGLMREISPSEKDLDIGCFTHLVGGREFAVTAFPSVANGPFWSPNSEIDVCYRKRLADGRFCISRFWKVERTPARSEGHTLGRGPIPAFT